MEILTILNWDRGANMKVSLRERNLNVKLSGLLHKITA